MLPIFDKTEEFFSKEGYESVVLEYEFIKKFLFVIIISLTIVLIIHYSNFFDQTNNLSNTTLGFTEYWLSSEKVNLESSVVYLASMLGYIAIAAFLRIITLNVKKEFQFYFAKACCKIISGKKEQVEKMKYLFLLLSSYNKYLQRNLKIDLNDKKKFIL